MKPVPTLHHHPLPTSGGSWTFANGKLTRDGDAPVEAPALTPPEPSSSNEEAPSPTTTADQPQNDDSDAVHAASRQRRIK